MLQILNQDSVSCRRQAVAQSSAHHTEFLKILCKSEKNLPIQVHQTIDPETHENRFVDDRCTPDHLPAIEMRIFQKLISCLYIFLTPG